MARERRPEVSGTTTLGADPRDEEDRVGHQLAQAAEVAGLGGADDGAHPAQPGFALQPRPPLGDHPRQMLVQGAAVGGQVEHVGRAWVGGANESEQPGSGARRGHDHRLERVAAEQRVDGRRVRGQPRELSRSRLQSTEHRLAIGGGADRHVAALAVGDDEQAGAARISDHLLERPPARPAEALEARQLRLHRDADRRRRRDQRAAVLNDRLGRGLGGRRARPRPRLEPGRIRVEAEAYLAAAL